MKSIDGGSRGGVKFANNKDEEERAWYKRRVGFLLYIKLSTLIGLTWAFGLVASILDMPSLWYPFIILNSLQGIFILVFFDLKWRVYYTAYEKLIGKSHPNRRRRKRAQPKLLKCLRPPEIVAVDQKSRLGVQNPDVQDELRDVEDTKKTPGLGKFKSKSILVKNALRLKKAQKREPLALVAEEENIEELNAWQQLKIFQRSISDNANSAREVDEEKRHRRKGVMTRQKGFEIAEETEDLRTGVVKKVKRLLASTDSEESTEPRKKMKRKRRRSQRRKPQTTDKGDFETPRCSDAVQQNIPHTTLPPSYRAPPEYSMLPLQPQVI